MSGFSIEWLKMREKADYRARDLSLLNHAQYFLRTQAALDFETIIADLGAGTGSTVRAFSKWERNFEETLNWRLIDNDKNLLDEAISCYDGPNSVQIFDLDLNDVSKLPLADVKFITMSALMDLVSADFIDALVETLQQLCAQRKVGFYSALNYDGATLWTPYNTFDEIVLQAFNQHQRSDKGFGLALGPDANDYLQKALRNAGFKVLTADSPWILDSSDDDLITKLIEGIANAVAETSVLDSSSLYDWVEFRKKNISGGTCIVGHRDILALPLID